MASNGISLAINALSASDFDGFKVIHQRNDWREDALRPLLVVVHPGDAIERACDWADKAVGAKVEAFSKANQAGMAKEILNKLETHDVIVLHRLSSSYLHEPGAIRDYCEVMDQCDAVGLVLYGDDLESASAWISTNVPGCMDKCIDVFMTGAYAASEYGCITAVGKALLLGNAGIKLKVSEHAPTDNSNDAPRWFPFGVVHSNTSEQIRDQSLSIQWNAQPGKGQEIGRIVAMSDAEVIQDAGRGRHVAWTSKGLQEQALEVGEQVTINDKGEVKRQSLDKGQGLGR